MKKFFFYFTILTLCLGCGDFDGGWARDDAKNTPIVLLTEGNAPIKNHKVILRTNSRVDSLVTDSLGKGIFNYLITTSDSNIETATFTPKQTANLMATRILKLDYYKPQENGKEYTLNMDSIVTYRIHLKREFSDAMECSVNIFSEEIGSINVKQKFVTFSRNIGKIDTIISFKAYKSVPFKIKAFISNNKGSYENIIGKSDEIIDKNRLIKAWFKI